MAYSLVLRPRRSPLFALALIASISAHWLLIRWWQQPSSVFEPFLPPQTIDVFIRTSPVDAGAETQISDIPTIVSAQSEVKDKVIDTDKTAADDHAAPEGSMLVPPLSTEPTVTQEKLNLTLPKSDDFNTQHQLQQPGERLGDTAVIFNPALAKQVMSAQKEKGRQTLAAELHRQRFGMDAADYNRVNHDLSVEIKTPAGCFQVKTEADGTNEQWFIIQCHDGRKSWQQRWQLAKKVGDYWRVP